jgi:hypothetical protein
MSIFVSALSTCALSSLSGQDLPHFNSTFCFAATCAVAEATVVAGHAVLLAVDLAVVVAVAVVVPVLTRVPPSVSLVTHHAKHCTKMLVAMHASAD